MAKTWRCFHCDEVFKTRREAYLHFGEDSGCVPDVPACVDPLRSDEKARMKELREAVEHGLKMQRRAERADDFESSLDLIMRDVRRYFGDDVTSIWQAGDRYKNAMSRIADLEALAVEAVENK